MASLSNSARPPRSRENAAVDFPATKPSYLPPVPADPSAFFRDFHWKNRFDDEILHAAKPLVSKVRNLRLEEPAADSFILLGNVGGEESEVGFWPAGDGWDLETNCSCDLGGFCHHAAALVLRAEKERDLSRMKGHGITAAVAAALPQPAPPTVAPPTLPEPTAA